jgi:hypothetical protein
VHIYILTLAQKKLANSVKCCHHHKLTTRSRQNITPIRGFQSIANSKQPLTLSHFPAFTTLSITDGRLTCLRPRQSGPFVSSSSSSLPLPVYTIFHDPIHVFPSLPAQTVSNEAANNPQNQHRNSPSIPTETPTMSSMPTTPSLTDLERALNEGK